MKKTWAWLLAAACLLIWAPSAFAVDPEFTYVLVDPDGQPMNKTAPEVYKHLHGCLDKSGLVKLMGLGDAAALFEEKQFKSFPQGAISLPTRIKKFTEVLEVQNLVIQFVHGRYDEGETEIWVVENNRFEIKGVSRKFSSKIKPPLGMVDTLTFQILDVLDGSGSHTKKLLQDEKYADLSDIIDRYRGLAGQGTVFSRLHNLEALQALSKHNKNAAEAFARKALAVDPYWPDNYEVLGKVLESQGRQASFSVELKKGLATYKNNLGLMLLKMSRMDPQKDADDLADLMKKARAIDPNQAALMGMAVRLSIAREDYDSVARTMDQFFALENLPLREKKEFGLEVARDLAKKGKYAQGAAVYAIILHHDPQASIFLEKANCHDRMGDLAGRQRAMIHAFTEMPDEQLIRPIINGARDLKKPTETLDALSLAKDTYPEDPAVLNLLALLSIMARNPEAAAGYAKTMEDQDPGSPNHARVNLFIAAAFLPPEKLPPALQAYNSAFEPLSEVQLGSELFRLGLFDKAEPLLATVFKTKAFELNVLYDLGICYIIMGDSKGFKKTVKKARSIEEKAPGTWLLFFGTFGAVRQSKGDLEKAVALAKQGAQFAGEPYRTEIFRHHVLTILADPARGMAAAFLDFVLGKIDEQTLESKVQIQ